MMVMPRKEAVEGFAPPADMDSLVARAKAARTARIVAEAVHTRATVEFAQAREAEACAKSDLTRAALGQAGYAPFD